MSTGRTYESSLRDERALETKKRIRSAAKALFGAKGFTNTTINEIARAAGVAPQTVYAVFGSKARIVSAMLEELEETADRAAWIDQMLAEPEARAQIGIFAAWIRSLFEQGAPVFRAALAARSDPDVSEFEARGNNARRDGTQRLTRIWDAKDALRPRLSQQEAADRLWLLTSLELYINATDTLGWEPDEYEKWLAGTLEREILGEP